MTPLVCITNLGAERWKEAKFSASFESASWCLEILSTIMAEPTGSVWQFMLEITFMAMHCQMCWKHFNKNWIFSTQANSIRFSLHCLFGGGNFKTPGNACKRKALKLAGPLDISSWNLSAPGFWIHTKGIIRHPNMDWPCQDFTHGLAREQPSLQLCLPLVSTFGCSEGETFSIETHPLSLIIKSYADNSKLSYTTNNVLAAAHSPIYIYIFWIKVCPISCLKNVKLNCTN